ncbi:glycerophosphodiester phosphodiesterase family protein [Bifidobacterium parmae]|uniref:Glycerophosphodiester phosphodiesterase n=1 Tax=Bifidobacterium parmae TaxID=361854 RepID=A0A2N5J571_9BIFI|nr:glycerophosphodiester phosphodiesterase family protein [Bifidobacterium parmae]PLS29339.1 glycerophosphodiester phosphodiesterase [Bifidobacterium parmae]
MEQWDTESRGGRRWIAHLIILAITLALVVGGAAVANLRRRERDGLDAAGTPAVSDSRDMWTVRPLAIAHRGDDSAPENSLHAIANAGARGADYAEIDIRLDADGTPVVFHDRRTGRLSADGRDVPVASTPTRVLQRMPMRQNGETFHIPTLAQAILAARRTNDHLGLLLHLKTDDRHAPRVTEAVSRQIERHDFASRVMIMSTDDAAIRLVHRAHPRWLVGKCVSPAGHARITWPRGASFVVMRGDRFDPRVARRAERDHMPVYAGVSGDYREANRCLKLGASGVLGDSARRLDHVVDRHAVRVDGRDMGDGPRTGARGGARGSGDAVPWARPLA